MKEMAAMMEVNQLLVSERSQLQMELHQTQTQLDREVEQHERRNQEVAQVLNKVLMVNLIKTTLYVPFVVLF